MVLAAATTAAVLAGCGQLFAQQQNSVTLTSLANRVDSLDAQVGELQAALASGAGTTTTSGAQQTEANGVVSSSLPVATVEADVLNVRSEPTLTGTLQGQLLQNARVNVLAVQGNWSEIRFTNPVTGLTLTGWVDSEYLGPSTIPDTGTPGKANGSTAAGAKTAGTVATSGSSVSGTMVSSSTSAS
jgi:hypothetical protein